MCTEPLPPGVYPIAVDKIYQYQNLYWLLSNSSDIVTLYVITILVTHAVIVKEAVLFTENCII
jgi:hypothetical protein